MNRSVQKWLPIATIALVALLFRLLLLRWRFAIGFDEPHYLQLGAAAAIGSWEAVLHPYWPPMYPALVALFSVFSHDFESVGRAVNILCGVATLVPIYVLARELFSETSARLATALLALFPALAFGATDALAESSYTLWTISGVATGWFALKVRSPALFAGTGVLFGLGYLTKPEGLGYLVVFAGVAALVGVWRLWRQRDRRLLLGAALTIAASLLVAFPYLVYLKGETGGWIISGKYKVNRFDVNSINYLSADDTQLPLDMAYHQGNFYEYNPETHAGKDGRTRTPGELAAWIAENLYKIFRSEMAGAMTAPLFALVVLGFFSQSWLREKAYMNFYLLLYFIFFWLMVIPFFHINARYFTPLLPLCFVWAGQGVCIAPKPFEQMISAVASGKIGQRAPLLAKAAVVAGLLGVSFLPEMGKIISRSPADTDFWNDAVELKAAGEWLRQNTQGPPVLMSYNKAVDFYAGQRDIRKTATFSYDNIHRIVRYAKHRGVTHLVLNERYRSNFPNLEPLFTLQEIPPELALVYDRQVVNGLRVRIFALNDSAAVEAAAN